MLYSPYLEKESPMPRRPRIEIAGYYHIVNRGVEQGKRGKRGQVREQKKGSGENDNSLSTPLNNSINKNRGYEAE